MSAMPKVTAADEALITTFGRLVEAYSTLDQQLGRSLDEGAVCLCSTLLARRRQPLASALDAALLGQDIGLAIAIAVVHESAAAARRGPRRWR